MMPCIGSHALLAERMAGGWQEKWRVTGDMGSASACCSRNPLIDATLTSDESGSRSDEHEIQDHGDSRDLSLEERHVASTRRTCSLRFNEAKSTDNLQPEILKLRRRETV